MRLLSLPLVLLGLVPFLASAQAVAPPSSVEPTPIDLATVDRANVQKRLGVYADPLARKGWLPAPGVDRTLGTLAQGAQAMFTVPLVAGYTYRAIGVCGRECSNLNIAVTGPAGEDVTRDRRADGVPIVNFRAASTGNYVMTVRMATCNVASCTYGAALYASPRAR